MIQTTIRSQETDETLKVLRGSLHFTRNEQEQLGAGFHVASKAVHHDSGTEIDVSELCEKRCSIFAFLALVSILGIGAWMLVFSIVKALLWLGHHLLAVIQ